MDIRFWTQNSYLQHSSSGRTSAPENYNPLRSDSCEQVAPDTSAQGSYTQGSITLAPVPRNYNPGQTIDY